MKSLKSELIDSSRNRHKNGTIDGSKQHSNDINSVNYDPIHDIFELFNDPSALNDIDNLNKFSELYQKNLEVEILDKREKYKEMLKSDKDQTENLDNQVLDLLESFQNLKTLAGYTGNTINSMTASIKKLDQCKKNLTFTMTTLKRLQMLVTAYDRLDKQLEIERQIKNYSEIKQLLGAVLELNEYFQDFKSIDEVNKLNRLISSMKNRLTQDIFNDFDSEFNEELINPKLIEACHILEMLGDQHKNQLESWYIKQTLKDINQIFTSTEEAGSLDNLNRRYIYFQNVLSNFESKHLKIFPKSWNMSYKLTEQFCSYTRNDLNNVLQKESTTKKGTDVNVLLNSLAHTLDFEAYLLKKFKYYQDFDDQLSNKKNIDFSKSISSVFEPYLSIWVDSQSKIIEKAIQEFSHPDKMFKKTGEGVDVDKDDKNNNNGEDSINILESAGELFRVYRQILGQLSKLTNGKSLIRLSKIFNKYLGQYQHKILDSILPDSKSLISVDIKSQEEGIDLICLVLNTASYCSSTIEQLEEKIKSLIEPESLSSQVEFETSTNGFLQLVVYCINLLFYKIENDVQLSWRELSNFNWLILDEVTGESRYVDSLKSIIREDCQFIFKKVSKVIYIRNLIDKIVDMLLKNILLNIVKLEPITIVMAEQFKLDIQEIKSFINILPTMVEGGSKILSSTSFKSSINTKFNNIDNLLKILMVSTKPMDTFINNYFSIIGDMNFSNFMKVLQLKGIMKSEVTEKDKFKYMDMFKLQLGSYEECNIDSQLNESNEFLEKLNVVNTTSTNVKRSQGHAKTNSRSIYLPSTITGISNNDNNSNLTLTPPELPSAPLDTSNTSPSTSPVPNFGFFNSPKTATNSILQSKDNIEKNLSKTFTENKTTFNENLKKFFKRG